MSYQFHGKQPAIEPGSLVLVSGVTGLIGGHIADKFLAAGYNVRGTSRSASKAQWTVNYFDKTYGKGRYEVFETPDLSDPATMKDALKGVSAVAHVASDLSFSPDPNVVVPTTISFLKSFLSLAAETPTVKRFVYTSSSTAMTMPKPGIEFTVDANTWNEDSVKAAWDGPPYKESNGWDVYAASKTQGEQEAWKFMKDTKPHFTLNTVLPNANFGRLLDKAQNSSTSGWPSMIYESGKLNKELVSAVDAQWYVDVEDDALLHVASVIDPDVKNERIFAFAGRWSWNMLLRVFRHIAPDRKFQDDVPDLQEDFMSIDTTRSVELLANFGQQGFTSLEDSLKKRMEFDNAVNA